MKLLSVLLVAAAQAYSVFEIGAACDTADETKACAGPNEWCQPTEDGKTAGTVSNYLERFCQKIVEFFTRSENTGKIIRTFF